MSLLVVAKQIGNAIAVDPNVPLALTESAGSGVRWPLSLLLGEAPDFCCIGFHGAAQGAEVQPRQGNDGNDQLTSHLYNPLNGSGEMFGEPMLQIRRLKRRCLTQRIRFALKNPEPSPKCPPRSRCSVIATSKSSRPCCSSCSRVSPPDSSASNRWMMASRF